MVSSKSRRGQLSLSAGSSGDAQTALGHPCRPGKKAPPAHAGSVHCRRLSGLLHGGPRDAPPGEKEPGSTQVRAGWVAQRRPGLNRGHPKSTCSLVFLLGGTWQHLEEPVGERGLPTARGTYQ